MSTTMNELDILYKRGFDLRCDGRYAEAKAVLTTVLAKDPTHQGAKHQIALIQGFEGDFEGSVEALSKLSVQAPRNLDVLYDLAMTQMMIGMSNEACANFRKMLAVDPHNEKASKQLIYCP
jgi:Flp pilus assembly protein TadD